MSALAARPFRRESIALIALAAPVIVNKVGMALMMVVDSLVAAASSTLTLAGVAVGSGGFFVLFIAAMGAVMGLEPVASAAVGRGDTETRDDALRSARVLSVGLGGVVAVGCLVMPLVLTWIGQPAGVVWSARSYLLGAAPGAVFGLLFTVNASYLSCVGKTRALLWVTLVMNLVNAGLDAFLVLGPVDHGALGVGIATSGCNLAAWLVTEALRWSDRYPEMCVSWRMPRPAVLRDVARLGWPVGVQYGLEAAGFGVVTFLMGTLGADIVAAHHIASNVIAMTFTAALGLSVAASARVGTARGRGDLDGVRTAAKAAFGIGAVYAVSCGVAIVVLRPIIVDAFNATGSVAVMATRFLFVAAIFQLADITQAIGFGVLRGMADTRVPMAFNLVGYWLVGLPLGYLGAFHFGDDPAWLWWGLCVALCGIAVSLIVRFRRLSDRSPDNAPLAEPGAA